MPCDLVVGECASVVDSMLADVLLSENKLVVGLEITRDCEVANFIVTVTSNCSLEDAHVVNLHGRLSPVLGIETSPRFGLLRDLETSCSAL